jgi:hypothetical protein
MRTRIPLTLALGLSLALAAFAQQPAAGQPDTKRVILAACCRNDEHAERSQCACRKSEKEQRFCIIEVGTTFGTI